VSPNGVAHHSFEIGPVFTLRKNMVAQSLRFVAPFHRFSYLKDDLTHNVIVRPTSTSAYPS
jgi:hypothetical protein